MDETTSRPQRLVALTEAALYDLAGIDNATAATWGEPQAERYLSYLRETFALLLDDPNLGSPIEGSPGYFSYTAKYSKRKAAHGHRIFYRPTDHGIRIIRILHTAMNWPDHFREEA